MNKKDKYLLLREKAEKLLQEKGLQKAEAYYNDIEKLVEELNIYHMELEIQNQELQEANQRIVAQQNRYEELYMHSPVAYFTLNETGNVIELNHAAADLLKMPVHAFKYTSLFPYLEEESKTEFSKYFRKVFHSEEVEYGEVVFVNSEGKRIYTNMNAVSYYDTTLEQKLLRCAVIDKTRVKQYEKKLAFHNELEESEKKLRTMFEKSGVVMLLIDPETQIIENASNAACAFYGYSLNELKRIKISDINQLKSEEVKQEIERTRQLGKKYFNFKHKLANGDIRDVEVYSTKIQFGETEKLFSIIHDITERKIAKERIMNMNVQLTNTIEELNATNEELKSANSIIDSERNQFLSLLDSIPEIIYVSDLETNKILFANKKLKEIIGRDVTGENCFEAIQGKKEKCNFCTNAHILHSQEPYFWEYYNPIFKKHFYIMDRKIKWTDKKEVRFELATDVTEQRESQNKIQQLNNRLEASMSVGDMAWWEMELPSGKISFNSNKTKMLGRKAEDFKHYSDFLELVHDDDKDKAMNAMRKHIEGKSRIYEIEYRIRNSENEFLWFYDVGHITSKKDGKLLLTGIVTDITARKLTELALSQNQKKIKKYNAELREANATKDKFFSIIAHDLKNPFNSIIGFSNLLMQYIDQYDKNKIKQMVASINASGQTTFNLLENLLEWSRAQTGRITFNPTTIRVENIFDAIIQQTRGQAKNKAIDLSCEIDGDLHVLADENMLTTILRNLTNNAIKFTPSGGKVTLNAASKKGEVLFCVNDNGVGMSKETIKKLFKVGEKISTYGTNEEKGTGLGLLLCKEFIEKHKGKIWVESEVGQGSTFLFTIP